MPAGNSVVCLCVDTRYWGVVQCKCWGVVQCKKQCRHAEPQQPCLARVTLQLGPAEQGLDYSWTTHSQHNMFKDLSVYCMHADCDITPLV